jgi:hypothetical protein
MKVNDPPEITIDDELILVPEPLDQTVEFTTVSMSIVDVPSPPRETDPVPSPEPYELDALIVELAIVSSLTCEFPPDDPPHPLPIPEPYELDALIVELAIVSSVTCEFGALYSAFPLPIPEPSELDALIVELAIVS